MASDPDGHLCCSVCFQSFDTQQRRPWDIGCGHSFCESCLRQHPRSFRYCPECRTRASNPHVNIALLRLLDSGGTAGSTSSSQQQQALVPTAAAASNSRWQEAGPAAPRAPDSHTVPAAAAAAAAAGGGPLSLSGHPTATSLRAGRAASALQHLSPADVHSSLTAHQAKIAQLRTAMWVYLTPVLGLLYLISPLDIIPDFLPLIGYLDDLLVLYYVACSLYNMLLRQPQQQNTMRL